MIDIKICGVQALIEKLYQDCIASNKAFRQETKIGRNEMHYCGITLNGCEHPCPYAGKIIFIKNKYETSKMMSQKYECLDEQRR